MTTMTITPMMIQSVLLLMESTFKRGKNRTYLQPSRSPSKPQAVILFIKRGAGAGNPDYAEDCFGCSQRSNTRIDSSNSGR
jgi:hypothetical protein